jgi:hypothetical protein
MERRERGSIILFWTIVFAVLALVVGGLAFLVVVLVRG